VQIYIINPYLQHDQRNFAKSSTPDDQRSHYNKNITTIIGPTPKTTFNRRDREFGANE